MPYTPTGDFHLDWDATGADGSTTVTSASGKAIGVTVSTPANPQETEFNLIRGDLIGGDVTEPLQTVVMFDSPVSDLNFGLNDVDQSALQDDKVTVLAYDAEGNLVDVDFSNLQSGQTVEGTTVNGGAQLEDEAVAVHVAGPVSKVVVVLDNGESAESADYITISDMGFNSGNPGLDYIVDGTSDDDLIDLDYTGDPQGDMVDNNDMIDGSNDDEIRAMSGDDTVYAGLGNDHVSGGRGDDVIHGEQGDDTLEGNNGNDIIDGGDGDDTIEGGGGDDTIDGGDGDDTIYGDYAPDSDGGPVRESFNWEGVSQDQADAGFTQDTGTVDVTYTILTDTGEHFVNPASEPLNVDGIDGGDETVDPDSGLWSTTAGEGNIGEFQWEFSQAVGNVQFNINDIDEDGVVTVSAFDADGNQIEVQLVGGSELTLLDTDGVLGNDTADSNGEGAEPHTDMYNLQVTIPGPVSRIVVEHTQDGGNNSGVVFTDMFFDVPSANEPDGDDTITGGAGADDMHGDGGDDTFIVSEAGDGSGDTVTGGAGANDHDVLDLRGAGEVVINQQADPTDPDAYMGTVTFTETGETLTFSQIEEILTDPQPNDAPDAVDDTITTDEDTPVVFDPLANDSDPDGDPLTVTEIGEPEHGTLTDNGDGTFTYTPDPDYNGPDTVTYTVSDGNGGTDTATITFGVDPVNDAPVAEDDAEATDEDTPVVISVLGNDSDVDGDTLSVTGHTDPSNGTVVDNGDGTFTYTPNPDFTGEDSFTYTISDGNGGTDEAEVTVTVGGVNDAPDAVDDTVTTDEDTPVVFDPLANDSDPDGDPLTVTEIGEPEHGTLTDNGDGTFTYTPDPDYNGPDTVTYTVSDGNGGTDTATITFGVDPVNDAPVAEDDAETTDEDTPVVISVLGNDSDVDGDTLSVTGHTDPSNGTVVDNGDGTFTYTPNPDFTGEDSFTYTISDGNGGTDEAEVTVTVGGVNDAPDAVDDTVTTDEDTPVVFDPLANDSDPDGDPLTVTEIGEPEHGTLTDNGDGTFTYTPDPDYNGPDTVTYTVSDGNGGTDTATITFGVDPVNDAPVAEDDAETTDEDTPVVISVLGNDSDVDGDTLSVTGHTDPSNGTVVDNGDGTFTYTPNPDFTGEDSFTYTISDGNGGTDEAEVTVTVGGVNDAPDAVDDTVTTDEDTPVVFDPLANDSDPDGDPLTVTEIGEPEHGTLTDNGDGTFTYTPDPDYNGPDTVTYTVSDGNGGTDTATITFDVAPANDDPVAEDDSETTILNTPVIIPVLVNDADPDGDPLSVIEATTPDGTVAILPDGTLEFTPTTGLDGPAQITYTISDGNGGTDTAVVDIMIRDGIVEGTSGDDVIDTDYTGDPEGDLVDNNDEFLPGEGPNDDIIEAYGGDDVVHAGAGDDDIDGGEGNDTLHGEEGDDEIDGGEGNDTITGGDGSDTVDGGEGDDVIDTSGTDPASDYGWGPVPQDADPDDDRDTVHGGEGNDTITTGDDADIIYGDEGDDAIDGGLDDDTIDGGEGDDEIIGGHGSDVIDGGEGDDVIYGGLGEPDDPINIPDDEDPRPDNGMDVIHGGEGDDTIFGEDDADELYGDQGDDTIHGGIDNDTIDGGSGEDTLFGDEGDDTISGGAGNDTIDGGDGEDTLSGGDDRDTFVNVGINDVIDGNEGGDDWDTLDLTGSAPEGGGLHVTYTTPDEETGFVTYYDDAGNVAGTLDFFNIERVIPCFTPGTLIATPKGERRVEDLRPGDRVITRDNGIQTIAWTGAREMDWKELAHAEHLRPVLIRAGALGNGLPERDMMVSPNHRVLVANDRTALYFDEREVLAAAKHLVDNEGIVQVDPMSVTYMHFMCERHEVVLSDGAWTETFQPGDYSLKGVGNAQRQELFELFPELETREGLEDYTAARRILKKHEARMLVGK